MAYHTQNKRQERRSKHCRSSLDVLLHLCIEIHMQICNLTSFPFLLPHFPVPSVSSACFQDDFSATLFHHMETTSILEYKSGEQVEQKTMALFHCCVLTMNFAHRTCHEKSLKGNLKCLHNIQQVLSKEWREGRETESFSQYWNKSSFLPLLWDGAKFVGNWETFWN